jgi:hypothetical protein
LFALAAPAGAQDAIVADVLSDPRYEFCGPDWRVRFNEADLCRFASQPLPACPGFAQACARLSPSLDQERSAYGADWLAPLAWLARGLFWLLLGVGAAWLLLQIVRNLRSGREDEAPVEGANTEELPAEPAAALRKLVDADALRLLSSARAAAGSGNLVLAAQLAHAALVRALEHDGHVRVDPCMSNGDYARALAGAPELCDTFRSVAREVERSEFSGQPPSAEAIAQLLSRVEPIVQRLVAVLLLAGGVLTSGCGLDGARGRGGDDSPSGGSVLARLLERSGSQVERRLNPLGEIENEFVDLLIVQPSGAVAEGDWPTVASWVSAGGGLVLVGPHAELSEQLGVSHDSVPCTGPAQLAAPALVPGGAQLVGLQRAIVPGDDWSSDVTCGDAAVIATRPFGNGRILLIAEPDFTSNASLAAGDHARVLLALLGSPGLVQVIDRFTAAGAKSPYRAIANSGLGPLLGHGLAWLVLWALAAGISFGTPRDSVEVPRRALSEHIRAVARCYERAGASRHALAAYATWALERLHSRLLPGKTAHGRELASRIAKATQRPEAEVARWLDNATAARDRPHEPNQAGPDLAAIAALGELVRETGGKR